MTKADPSRWKIQAARFLSSQALSLFGSSLVQYAILWHITLKTQSGVMMTLYLVFGFLPAFFLSPFAGVWADRYNRKHLIMAADGLIALATLVLALLYLLGYQVLWLLFFMAMVRSLGSAVHTPAVSAFLPQFIPREHLMRTNAFFSSAHSLIMLASPMVSGALLTISNLETIFMVDVVTAALAIILLMTLKVPSHVQPGARPPVAYWQDMKDGLAYIRQHGYVRRFFVFCAVFFWLITPAATLTPLQVTRSFGEDVWRLTAVEVAFSIGMLLGGLLIAAWGGLKNRVKTMALSTLMVGLTTFLLGVVSVFWIYLLIMIFVGVFIPLFNTPATVMLQEKVEAEYLGRVFGVLGMISSGTMPVAMLLFGPLADVVSIEWQLAVTGLILLGLGVALGRNKVLVHAGQPQDAQVHSVRDPDAQPR